MHGLIVDQSRPAGPNWLIAIAPAFPALALLIATFDLSYGLTPDSLAYLQAAEDIRRTGWVGPEFQFWPPLYPALLALGGWIGLDTASFAALLARAGSFATVLGAWAIGRSVLASRVSLTLALLALTSLPQFGLVFGHVWSETIYVPLAVWIAYIWTRYLSGGTGLTAACVLLSLALLTRHVGVVLAIAMGITALIARRPRALAFIGLACVPFGAWLVRTYLLSGTIAGHRPLLANPDLIGKVEQFGRVFGHWFFPHFYFSSGGILVAALLLLALLALLAHSFKRGHSFLTFAALFALGHSVLTVYSASRVTLDVDGRTLFPILWAVLLAMAWAIESLGRRLECTKPHVAPWFYMVVGLYCLLWFAAPNAIVNALI